MTNKKKSAKAKAAKAKGKKIRKQAAADIANLLKASKNLEAELKKVSKDIKIMIPHTYTGPPYSGCPPGE